MKKKLALILVLLLTVTLVAASFVCVSAQSNRNRVLDDAGLLTTSEEAELERELAEWCNANRFDVVIVTTTKGLVRDTDTTGITAFADDFYDYNGYGYGKDGDGCILVVDMESREYWISTKGFGITALTDYGISKLGDKIASDLGDEDYMGAFEDAFFGNVQWMYSDAKEGKPYDRVKPSLRNPVTLLCILAIALIPGMIIGLISASRHKRALKSIRRKYEAQNYIREGSLNLTKCYDRFLFSTISRMEKPKDDGKDGLGGSSTHVSSSGSSHGGGGGRF